MFKFQKEVSGFGGVRVSASMTRAFLRSGRVKSIFIVKEREGNATYYRGSIDLGNVTYARYMKTILSKEIFEELFGTRGLQTWSKRSWALLRLRRCCRTSSRRGGMQRGFEESLKRVTASLHDYSSLDNRRRVRVRVLDPYSLEAQTIPIILKKICGVGIVPKYTIPSLVGVEQPADQMDVDDEGSKEDEHVHDDVEMGTGEETKEKMEVEEEPKEDVSDPHEGTAGAHCET